MAKELYNGMLAGELPDLQWRLAGPRGQRRRDGPAA